jgi:hypothetical protein
MFVEAAIVVDSKAIPTEALITENNKILFCFFKEEKKQHLFL